MTDESYDIFDFDVSIGCAPAPLYGDIPAVMSNGVLLEGITLFDPTAFSSEIVVRYDAADSTIKFFSVAQHHLSEIKISITRNPVYKRISEIKLADASIKSIKMVRVAKDQQYFAIEVIIKHSGTSFKFCDDELAL